MTSRSTVALVLAVVLIGACNPAPRGAVRPAPPGPLDAVRSLWGDYSGRCPEEYDYCPGGVRALCCPFERGCCEGADGPYCCSRAEPDWTGRDRDEDGRRSYDTCGSRELTCSHRGRTICCATADGCCADDDGPYCCASDQSRDRYRDGY